MNKSFNTRFGNVALGVCCMVLGVCRSAALAAKPSAEELQALEQQFERIKYMVGELNFPDSATMDWKKLRVTGGPGAVALLDRQYEQMKQFAAQSPQAEAIARTELLYETARIAYWGKAEANDSIQQMAGSDDPTMALRGKIAQYWVSWIAAGDDAQAQADVVSAFGTLVQSNPNSDDLARAMANLVGRSTSSPKAAHGINLLVGEIKSPYAIWYSKQPARVGEPLVITGKPLKGPEISTAKWKGKVIMIDFWATWCPPCRASLPEVVANYQKYHDQGFEILGVSNDSVRSDLTSFLAQQPDMVWPQLFTANDSGRWHPLASKMAINGIPTVFLIDRNGILRERETAMPLQKQLIEKLLAGDDDKAPARTATAGNAGTDTSPAGSAASATPPSATPPAVHPAAVNPPAPKTDDSGL